MTTTTKLFQLFKECLLPPGPLGMGTKYCSQEQSTAILCNQLAAHYHTFTSNAKYIDKDEL